MSAWEWGRVTLVAGVTLFVATLGLAIWGIWEQDVRGVAALVTGIAGFPAALGGLLLINDNRRPEKPARLPRAERKRLQAEATRIEFERRVQEMEREAGLR